MLAAATSNRCMLAIIYFGGRFAGSAAAGIHSRTPSETYGTFMNTPPCPFREPARRRPHVTFRCQELRAKVPAEPCRDASDRPSRDRSAGEPGLRWRYGPDVLSGGTPSTALPIPARNAR